MHSGDATKLPQLPHCDFFFSSTYPRLLNHIKDCTLPGNGSSAATVNVSDSDPLFKSRSCTYSPIWSQLSRKPAQLQRCSQSTKWKRYKQAETSCGEHWHSEMLGCCVKFYSEEDRMWVCGCVLYLCVMCVCVCGFSYTTGHEIFSLFKAVKVSLMKSWAAFIIRPQRRLSTVLFFFFGGTFTSVYNAPHSVVRMNGHDIFQR